MDQIVFDVRYVPTACRKYVQQTAGYSIISSARASNVGGISTPIALAACGPGSGFAIN